MFNCVKIVMKKTHVAFDVFVFARRLKIVSKFIFVVFVALAHIIYEKLKQRVKILKK